MLPQFHKKKNLTTLPSYGQFLVSLFNTTPWNRMKRADSFCGFPIASRAFSSEWRMSAGGNADEPVVTWLVTVVSEPGLSPPSHPPQRCCDAYEAFCSAWRHVAALGIGGDVCPHRSPTKTMSGPRGFIFSFETI